MSPRHRQLAGSAIAQLRAHALAVTLELGPYSLRVVELDPDDMPKLRRHACLDLTHSRITLRRDLTPSQWMRAFVHTLVRVIHYSHATLIHASTEEHLTHSLASGLSQLARRNPQFTWALLRALNPHVRRSDSAPVRIAVGAVSWRVTLLTHKAATRLRVFGQADLQRRRLELDPALSGTQLAVIFLHELLHGLHDAVGVVDHTPPHVAHARESIALSRFLAHNPQAAGWWFGLLQARTDPARAMQARATPARSNPVRTGAARSSQAAVAGTRRSRAAGRHRVASRTRA